MRCDLDEVEREGTGMSGLDRVAGWIKGAVILVDYLATATLWLLMLLIIWGVIARLAGAPISGVINLSESLLVVAIYLGIARTQQAKHHVSLELVTMRLSERHRRLLNLFVVTPVSIAICSVFVLSSWDYALEAWRIREKMDGAPYYPIYPPKIAVAVGLSLLWLQLLVDLVETILSARSGGSDRK